MTTSVQSRGPLNSA